MSKPEGGAKSAQPEKYEKGRASRDRFLLAAAELLQERGYYGTGLNEILARSGAPRGSLYHHFPGGKDELTIAALRTAGERLSASLAAGLESAADLAAGLRAFFDYFRNELRASEFRKGCPIAAVAQEVGGDHPEILAACGAIYADWEHQLTRLFSPNRTIVSESDTASAPEQNRTFVSVPGSDSESATNETRRAGEAARLVLSTLEGALLLARTRHDLSYLDLAEAHLVEMVQANGGA